MNISSYAYWVNTWDWNFWITPLSLKIPELFSTQVYYFDMFESSSCPTILPIFNVADLFNVMKCLFICQFMLLKNFFGCSSLYILDFNWQNVGSLRKKLLFHIQVESPFFFPLASNFINVHHGIDGIARILNIIHSHIKVF